MAHTKAGGKTKQKKQRSGKRLGIKLYHGEKVGMGQIIVRQRGSQFHQGGGVATGRDFTLFATKEGKVEFSQKKGKHIVSVK